MSTTTVTVRFFAQLRHAAGAAEQSVEVQPGSDVRALARRLEAQHEGLSLDGTMCAVDERYADPSTRLEGGETVAFLPPVSGG
jgi:molybdopterin synthase sulfur carrier subunit